jgi:heterodisulfide reductase subunit C
MDELLKLPEIWYCISCRRCLHVCPNLVKPQTIIAHIRNFLVADGAIPILKLIKYKELFLHFQRARWIATAKCMQGEFNPIAATTFGDWLQASIPVENSVIPLNDHLRGSVDFRKAAHNFNTALCYTCGECSSACPVSFERSVFDARTIFRMANFGLMDELLNSPSLWLCIGCGRCSNACSQSVDGRNLIENLKQMVVERGIVDSGFRFRLEKANRVIYSHFLAQIDSLLQSGAYGGHFTTSEGISALSASHSTVN